MVGLFLACFLSVLLRIINMFNMSVEADFKFVYSLTLKIKINN